MRVGVLGGTGPAGGALALRLASVGYEVVIGSRDRDRAATIAAELAAPHAGRNLSLTGDANEVAAAAELVVVATPWDAAGATAKAVGEHLAGKVVVSMANAIAKVGAEMQPLIPPRGSVAAEVAAAVPAARVTAAFHHVPAHELGDLDHAVECDVLVCSDDPGAREATYALVDSIPGLRAVNGGRLSNAAAVEAFTAVMLGVNRRYKTRTTIRLVGLPEKEGRE